MSASYSYIQYVWGQYAMRNLRANDRTTPSASMPHQGASFFIFLPQNFAQLSGGRLEGGMSGKPSSFFTLRLLANGHHGMERRWYGLDNDNDNSKWHRSKSSKHRRLRHSHAIVSSLHVDCCIEGEERPDESSSRAVFS